MFEVKSKKYMPFFVRVSARYAIPGRVDAEDLLQECLIALQDLLQTYDNLSGVEFDMLVHRSVVNHVVDQSHRLHTSECRDYRREEGALRGAYHREHWPNRRDLFGPEDQAVYNEYVERIRRTLPEKGQQVLDLFISQDTNTVRREIEEFNAAPLDGHTYNVRCGPALSTTFVAKHFNWSTRAARKYVKLVRDATRTVMGEVA